MLDALSVRLTGQDGRPRREEKALLLGRGRRPFGTSRPDAAMGHRLAGAGSGKVGEGAGRPGLARCFDSFTVSTKPTLAALLIRP
jgi:hypothetical protein